MNRLAERDRANPLDTHQVLGPVFVLGIFRHASRAKGCLGDRHFAAIAKFDHELINLHNKLFNFAQSDVAAPWDDSFVETPSACFNAYAHPPTNSSS
jgi:hypothetical protein